MSVSVVGLVLWPCSKQQPHAGAARTLTPLTPSASPPPIRVGGEVPREAVVGLRKSYGEAHHSTGRLVPLAPPTKGSEWNERR